MYIDVIYCLCNYKSLQVHKVNRDRGRIMYVTLSFLLALLSASGKFPYKMYLDKKMNDNYIARKCCRLSLAVLQNKKKLWTFCKSKILSISVISCTFVHVTQEPFLSMGWTFKYDPAPVCRST